MLKLHDYQLTARDWLLDNPRAGLFLEPGLGKTITTISALDALQLFGDLGRVLLIAPLRVARDSWPAELEKWSDFHDLSHAVAIGSAEKRAAALAAEADVTIASISNLVWLLDQYIADSPTEDCKPMPFDTLIVDELSLFKSRKSQRFKKLQPHLRRFERIYGLTGTPAPNSLLDLWAQMGVIDQGATLGPKFTPFRAKYFHVGTKPNGYPKDPRFETSFDLNIGADEEIYEAISANVISMRSADHLDLPECTPVEHRIELGPRLMRDYREFVREQVLALPEGELTAQNAAVLSGKLQQFAGGAVYDEERTVLPVHSAKVERAREIVDELQGSPVIIFYAFKHELARLHAEFSEAEEYGDDTLERWNAGEIPVLLLHPASAGHGLNLQKGGHTAIWFGLSWSNELTVQANGRIHRQGQEHASVIHYLMAAGTVDEHMRVVVEGKAEGENALLDAMRAEVARAA